MNPTSHHHSHQPLPPHIEAIVGPVPEFGIHAWLFMAALKLRDLCSPEEIYRFLRHQTLHCRRGVPESEISEAVNNSARIRNNDDQPSLTSRRYGEYNGRRSRWPEVDGFAVRQVVSSYDNPVKRLWEASNLGSLEYFHLNFAPSLVKVLFPGDPLICAGASVRQMRTKPLSEWGAEFCSTELIVPSPMIDRVGINQNGKRSTRCLANTGPRRFLVVEFDELTIEEQACLHMHLSRRFPLAMVVHSGKKSLHGWYYVAGQSEESAHSFMRYAVSLGADPATWTRCQAVRTPAGERWVGLQLVRQQVYFVNSNYEKR